MTTVCEEYDGKPVYTFGVTNQDEVQRASIVLGMANRHARSIREFTQREVLWDTGAHFSVFPESWRFDHQNQEVIRPIRIRKRPLGFTGDRLRWAGETWPINFAEVTLYIQTKQRTLLLWTAVVGFWKAKKRGLLGMADGINLFLTAYDPVDGTIAAQPTERFERLGRYKGRVLAADESGHVRIPRR